MECKSEATSKIAVDLDYQSIVNFNTSKADDGESCLRVEAERGDGKDGDEELERGRGRRGFNLRKRTT